MKLGGNLRDLVRVDGNKRDQLLDLPPPRPEVQQTTSKAGRRPDKEPGVVYIKTALELPEEVKIEFDRLFLDYRQELGGKNQFMVKAIKEAVQKFRDTKNIIK